MLGLNPALGRLLGPEDDRVDGQAESVVLSHAYWQSELGGDPQIVGRRLIVNGQPLTIVGVAPPGFAGTTVGTRASVFVPITMRNRLPITHDSRLTYWVHLFARLEPGVTREEAAAAINPLYRAIVSESEAPLLTGTTEQELEAFRTRPLVLEPGARGQTSESRTLDPARSSLELLLAVACAVLLLCCANVAGLMLVRSTARTGEIAVRASMGATRGRLASLLLAESLVLALPAAILSLPIALLTLRAVARGVPRIPTAAFDVELSATAALVAIGAAVLSAVVCGLLPLRDVLRTDPGKTLQAYGVRQTPARGVTRFRAGLATAQVALSMALLAITGVFAQSLANIARIDLGLDVDSVVMVTIADDPSVPIARLVTMEEQFLANIATERFVAGASTGFAVLATVLAGLGLYGVLAYAVAQRSREIALRFALGAPAPRIRRMVLRQIAAMAAVGIVLGAGVAVLGAVMLGAAYLPARRASRVDPMAVLRYE